MFKSLGNIASLLSKAREMGGRVQAITDELRGRRARGAAGGGMIEAEVNGLGELLSISIDPMLIERGEREMIEDLIPAAVNQAQTKAKQMHAEAMQSMAADLDVPGLNESLARFTGGEPNPPNVDGPES